MENASKALIMAAGVLIAIMILSLGIYLITTFGSLSAKEHAKIAENQKLEFNNQFYQYQGRNDITIYEIVTVTNYAKNNNMKLELETPNTRPSNYKQMNYVAVTLKNKELETTTKEGLNTYITESLKSIEKQAKYKCADENIIINKASGLVCEIIFNEVE